MRETGVEFENKHAFDIVQDDVRFVFCDPQDVVRHPRLSFSQKRALLASWASDRHSVEDAPELRQLDSGAIVRRDSIINALKQLDELEPQVSAKAPIRRPAFRLLRRHWNTVRKTTPRPDDDPPPPRPIRIRLHAAA